jgi:hypothetical protein
MTHYKFVVLSNPLPGRADDFNQWYDQDHLPQILAIKGMESAQRFRLADEPGAQPRSDPPYGYLTLYEISTDDIGSVVAELTNPSSGRVPTDAIDPATFSWMFVEMGEPRLPES